MSMRPSRTSSSASRPARSPKSGYAVLRSITVVPRRPAPGNVWYGTVLMRDVRMDRVRFVRGLAACE